MIKKKSLQKAGIEGTCTHAQSLSYVCLLAPHQVPLSMGLSRQEYSSGLTFPPSGDLSHPGIKPCLLHWQADSLPVTTWDILECEVKWALDASLWMKLVEVIEFQLSYFKSWKMMLWKCCTQYASKFGKLSGATGLEKVSFHSNPKERQYQRMLKIPSNCTQLTR